MAENSKIEWTHHTFNPWIGCQKVGPGCDHCYAEAMMDARLGRVEWGPHGARQRTSAANWSKPLKWDRDAAAAGERRRVFCASLADVFDNHPSILPEWRADLWKLIGRTPNLDWMLLTKRPGNISKMLPKTERAPWGELWPWSNVWLGCTVVNQAEADRDIPKLLDAPAVVRFLSMEPLLGPVDLTLNGAVCLPCPNAVDGLSMDWDTGAYECCRRCDYTGIGDEWGVDLVIVGGESGPGARPMHPDWARSLRDQCQAAGVAFFFKQWGEWSPIERVLPSQSEDMTFWPDGTFGSGNANDNGGLGRSMRRLGKQRAGRLLDGRTWDQMPGVAGWEAFAPGERP